MIAKSGKYSIRFYNKEKLPLNVVTNKDFIIICIKTTIIYKGQPRQKWEEIDVIPLLF